MLVSDIRDVTAADTDIVQLAVGQVLQLAVGAIVFCCPGAIFLYALKQARNARGQVGAVKCQCCCMCHISIPFECRSVFPDVTYFVPSLDRAEIGAEDNANNVEFGLSAMRFRNDDIRVRRPRLIGGVVGISKIKNRIRLPEQEQIFRQFGQTVQIVQQDFISVERQKDVGGSIIANIVIIRIQNAITVGVEIRK